MKQFLITLDLTLSGDFEIEAENEQEAREKILHKFIDNYNRASMHELSREIYQVEKL